VLGHPAGHLSAECVEAFAAVIEDHEAPAGTRAFGARRPAGGATVRVPCQSAPQPLLLIGSENRGDFMCAATAGAIAQDKPAGRTTATRADATTLSPRHPRGLEVLAKLNNGNQQPVFEAMRKEFPFLAESAASYALGDVWRRQVLGARTRQLSATAALAALGLRSFYKTHAGDALDARVSPEELKAGDLPHHRSRWFPKSDRGTPGTLGRAWFGSEEVSRRT